MFADDAWHGGVKCPNCRATVRHRLLAAALAQLPALSSSKIVRGKRILHFAVEPGLQALLQPAAATYFGTDYCAPTCRYLTNVKADMTKLPFGPGAFDLVVACDVLEHVPDDAGALADLHRILAPGGYAILTVPQVDDRPATLEDPAVQSAAERQRVYGQWDHLRLYGQDFAERVRQAGFDIQEVCEGDFRPEVVSRHVLAPPTANDDPLAPNFRKVFFAKR